MLEVRLGLEELAVKLACQRITESELQKLYQASRSFEQMLETTETDDLQKLAQADVAFHDVIYQATNNERLIQLLNNLREQMYRYRIEYLKDVKSRRSLVEEHDALYERVKNGTRGRTEDDPRAYRAAAGEYYADRTSPEYGGG